MTILSTAWTDTIGGESDSIQHPEDMSIPVENVSTLDPTGM